MRPLKFRRIVGSLCLATLTLRLPEVDEQNCLNNVTLVLVSVSSFPSSLRKGGNLKFTENCVQGFHIISDKPLHLPVYY